MFFGMYGVSIGHKAKASAVTLVMVAALMAAIGCGGESQKVETASVSDSTDIKLIQEMFMEAANRWHYGDKAVLYDLEFEYVQDKYTYDEYLDFGQIKYLEADSLVAIVVKDVTLFDRDSAHVMADAVFVGPSGDTSHFLDENPYHLYFHRGRWIHPSVGSIDLQLEYEEVQRVADSAAAAEAMLEDL